MSFTGKLLRVELGPVRSAIGSDHPEQQYPTWCFVVETLLGINTACSGRTDFRDRALKLIGQQVTVIRGGKEGIVGGIIPAKDDIEQ